MINCEHEKLMDKIKSFTHECGIVKTIDIPFSRDVIAACERNYCGMYNARWTCPPAVGDLESLIAMCKNYENALIFTTKHGIEDSFDIEGMFAAREEHNVVQDEVEKALGLEDYLILSAGACSICAKCTYPNEKCRFPEKAKISMEASGINVVDLSAQMGIRYHNGVNTVTYFSAVLLR